MSQASQCPECGGGLPARTPKGLCSRCALLGALELSNGASQLLQTGDAATAAHSRPKPSEGPLWTMKRFGDYELLEEIARGGMGVVYKARQISLDRMVAMKLLLRGEFASEDFIKRFRIEASAAAALQHPNIVAIHEVGVHDGEHFLVMDYVAGSNLARVARGEILRPKRAAQYLKTIAEAIHYAHEHGILHRDLKPSNILIDANDQPRVTDFGLAKVLTTGSQHSTVDVQLTQPGHVLGSPGYMPPEQAGGGRGKVSRRSDVYSLGAMLYHLLTARPPFCGGSIAETLQQVETQEPVAPRLLNPGVPLDLETICLKCLEKGPDRRYQTSRELAEELGRFLRDEPIQARPVSRPEKLWRWGRRNPVGAAFIAALVLGVMTTTLLLVRLQRSQTQTEQARREAEKGEAVARQRAEAIQDGLLASIERLWPDPERQFEYISSEQLSAFLEEPKPAVDYEAPHQRLAVGVSVTESPLSQVAKYARPFLEIENRMSEALGLRVLLDLKLFKYKNAKVAETISSAVGKVNFSSVGPLAYVKAKSLQPGLIPIARDEMSKPAVFYAKKGSGLTNLNQIAGKRVAFGSPGATISAMAKVELARAGIMGTNLAGWQHWNTRSNYLAKLLKSGLRNTSLERSHSHSAAIGAVTNDLAEVGVARQDFVQDLTKHRLEIISGFESPPQLWVASTNVAPHLIDAFRKALIGTKTIELVGGPHRRQISRMVAVDDAYYDSLRQALTNEVRRFEGDQPVQSSEAGELFEDDE